MYRKNDVIIYASQGVCKVTDIRSEAFAGGERREYYVLESLNQSNFTAYLPTDNDDETNRIRRILSKEEIDELIEAMPSIKTVWTEDHRVRRQHIAAILHSADSASLVRLIRTIYEQKQRLVEAGKKLPAEETNAMKEAEDKLYCEFAYALGIEKEDVPDYIQDHIG